MLRTALRGVTSAIVVAARLLTGRRLGATRAKQDFRDWICAADADPAELSELHRRMLRDKARRLIDREAALIARGQRSRDLGWIAQEIPATHSQAVAVRALALHTGASVTPEYPSGFPERLRARRETTAHHLDGLRQDSAHNSARALRIAHARAASLALRLALAWQRPCAPRAPASTRLA
ncbi:hypothetical protein [Homoserinimonas hongtaonis]|uniref:hypothetical protein n=1 Tax=Homoserinimonas hongtaonis TaxID=2079791 RepID=UPI00131F08C6|nr:hypothetical protein [Salinibacterium hongtaonis]